MHELGIVFHIANSVEEVALANNVKHIASVTVEVGEVSTVIPEYLMDCWKWNCKRNPMFTDCQLIFEKIKAVTFCEDCQSQYPTVEYGKICPNCNSENTYLITGNEVNIKEISVDDEE